MHNSALKEFIHHCIQEDKTILEMRETLSTHSEVLDLIVGKLTNIEERAMIEPYTIARHSDQLHDHERRLKKLENHTQ